MGARVLSYDELGIPVVQAENPHQAYYGIGYAHGLHRPLQALVLGAAGRGVLAEHLLGRDDLVALDCLAHRLDLPGHAEREAARLPNPCGLWVDAYVAGFARGLAEGGSPFELRLLAARLPPLSRQSVVAGLMLAAFLGLAEGQERMERALVDALAAGASPGLLAAMFAPHLDGCDVGLVRTLPRASAPGFAAFGRLPRTGGSNAWGIDGSRTESGKSVLCGDPHLQVNQLPSLFLELKVALGDDYWLGATIPGLPGLAVGRNRQIAWSGTFAVADNVDFVIEELVADHAARLGAVPESLVTREAVVRRRGRSPLALRFFSTSHGTLEVDASHATARAAVRDGPALAARWAGADGAGAALAAYMGLPLCTSASAAELCLDAASTYSLHFVLADAGEVRYCQAGRIPRRSGGWSGLYPVPAGGAKHWQGFYEGANLPRSLARDGVVASANEARLAADGGVLSTLAQPGYRLARIEAQLRARRDHDVASMRALQLDVVSLQAEALAPRLIARLGDGPLRHALAAWDYAYGPESRGAHAFDLAYGAVRAALAPELGGEWWSSMLGQSELGVWWCNAIDRTLTDDDSWRGARGERLEASLAAVGLREPERWGDVHRFAMPHLVLGGLPRAFGFDRGPFALPGCTATVCQGTIVTPQGRAAVTAPAYRFICDFAGSGAWTAIAGGVDGSRFSTSYDCFLDEWLRGDYHHVAAPSRDG